MDYKELQFYWNIALTIITASLGIWSYLSNRHRATKDMVVELDSRVQLLEDRSNKAISHNDIAKVHQRISEVAQAVKNQEGQLSQVNRTLTLINQHLINQNNGD